MVVIINLLGPTINVFCDSQFTDFEKESNKYNYIIVNDLWDFIRSPGKNILSHHNFFTWTIPTFILFGLDYKLTHFYINEVEVVIRNAREEGYIVSLDDSLIFNCLKALHILNAVYLDNCKLYRFTHMASEAIIDSYFVSQSIKMLTGRARPILSDEGPNSWLHPTLDPMGKHTSFPSLHATYFFSLSTIIGKSINNEIMGDVIGIVSYFSVVGHNHWISDMWIGYLLGKSIGNYVWNKNKHIDFRDKWWLHFTFRQDILSSYPSICILKFF